MTLDEHITAGAEAGIISPEQALELSRFIAARQSPDADQLTDADAESVRFARGFHDVFLTIGLVILMVGVVYSTGIVAGGFAGFLGAGVAWLLSEYYARARKLVLPSIALGIGFTLMFAFAAGMLAEMMLNDEHQSPDDWLSWSGLIVALAGLAASGGFLARFRLPFATGMVAVSATVTLAAIIAVAAPNMLEQLMRPLFFVAGATIFCAAMIYDLSDPKRNTLRADNAFWLHLAAGPLIVHSVVGAITGDDVDITFVQAAMILAVLFVLGVVALIIDRRAMLVAGLAYLGIAIAVLVREAQVDTGSVFAITLLFLGAAVVVLGTGWRSARCAIVETLVPANLRDHLPTIRVDPNE